MSEKIYERTIIHEIKKYLTTDDVIVLHGARQVGKTSILYWLKNHLEDKKETVHYIDLEDSRFVKILDQGTDAFVHYLSEEGLDVRSSSFSHQKRLFVFIDEIQYLANPSSFLKLTTDHYKQIKLIVSGSSSFEIKKKFQDSLVGRTIHFEVFNLSFKEFLLFKNCPFDEEKIFTEKKIDELRTLFKEYALYGGYPKIVLTTEIDKKERYLQQIIDTYVKKDIRDLADVKDVDKFNKLLEALAAQSGSLLNITELSNTCRIAKQTVEHYLFILENTYVLKLIRPYHKNIRSELFKVPKIYFYDTGLLQMLWLKNLPKEITGPVFETAVFAELVKRYRQENVFYWRTTDKKEIDFIVRQKSGILPVEAKLNFQQFNPTAVRYFNKEYKLKNYRVTSIEGEQKNQSCIYPWNL